MEIEYIVTLAIIGIFIFIFMYIEPMLAKHKFKIVMNMVVQDLQLNLK